MEHLLTIFQKCVFKNVLLAVESTITQILILVGAYKHAHLLIVNLEITPRKHVNQNA
jgi:hypothetical protein